MGRYIVRNTGGTGSTNLNGLTDVEVVAPVNDDLLVYDNVTSEWKNNDVLTTSGISQFNVVSPSDNDILVYDGVSSEWNNQQDIPSVDGGTY